MHRILALVFLFALTLNTAKAADEKEWTFLLYLNGKNNLDSFGKLNINQMEKVGSSDQVNLVVQWASIAARNNTKRLLVQKDDDFTNVTSPVVQDIGAVDMGSAQTLEDFIRWGITNYPAKHYFVAVWDHGSGWHLSSSGFQTSNISWDDATGHSITTPQLGAVMNNVAAWLGRKIDIYGSDACLMAMVEIAGEMKNSVDYFFGSEKVEPGAGWPYTEMFAPLIANPQLTAREFSILSAEAYTKSYSPGGSNSVQDVTMSAFDMSQYPAMEAALTNLGAATIAAPKAEIAKVFQAAKTALSFDYSDYVDLGDFLKKLTAQNVAGLDPLAVSNTSDALSRFVIASYNTGRMLPATGAAIWIPKRKSQLDSFLTRYRELDFEKVTHWSDALASFVP